tara:strand:+ start:610 stop:1227 length:618 start_codon:yes stop_codon:yes gene_type:complete
MKTESKTSQGAATTGVLAALAASSCCIPPVIAAIAGVGGMGSTLSWMEPFRPYLIGLSVVAIGYAWYAHIKPKDADDCGCDIEKPKWYQTKGFLIGITIFAAVSIAFPYYSGIFFSDNTANKTIIVKESDIVEATITIDGMTCTGCEHHVNSTLNNSVGVIEASSSFETGKAQVKFDKTKVSIDELVKEVEKETGYKVTDKKISE